MGDAPAEEAAASDGRAASADGRASADSTDSGDASSLDAGGGGGASDDKQEEEEQDASSKPGAPAVLRLRGLPFSAAAADIEAFFSPRFLDEVLICRRHGE